MEQAVPRLHYPPVLQQSDHYVSTVLSVPPLWSSDLCFPAQISSVSSELSQVTPSSITTCPSALFGVVVLVWGIGV